MKRDRSGQTQNFVCRLEVDETDTDTELDAMSTATGKHETKTERLTGRAPASRVVVAETEPRGLRPGPSPSPSSPQPPTIRHILQTHRHAWSRDDDTRLIDTVVECARQRPGLSAVVLGTAEEELFWAAVAGRLRPSQLGWSGARAHARFQELRSSIVGLDMLVMNRVGAREQGNIVPYLMHGVDGRTGDGSRCRGHIKALETKLEHPLFSSQPLYGRVRLL